MHDDNGNGMTIAVKKKTTSASSQQLAPVRRQSYLLFSRTIHKEYWCLKIEIYEWEREIRKNNKLYERIRLKTIENEMIDEKKGRFIIKWIRLKFGEIVNENDCQK